MGEKCLNNKHTILLSVFIVLNVMLYFFSVKNASFIEGADVGQYLSPAISLVESGEFRIGHQLFSMGTPLYSIMLAIPIGVLGLENSTGVIIIAQCSMLFLTGTMLRKLAVIMLRKDSYLLHGLLILNPNSLISAHLIQSETLFTFLLVATILNAFIIINNPSRKEFILLGLFLGLLVLTRPAGLYWGLSLPFIIMFSVFVKYKFVSSEGIGVLKVKEFTLNIILTIVICFIVISPWCIRNYINFSELFLSTNKGYYLKDQNIQLLRIGRHWSEKDAVTYIKKTQNEYYKDYPKGELCLRSERHWSCNDDLSNIIYTNLVNESLTHHLIALTRSWGLLYFSGGASNFRNYLGFTGKEHIVAFDKKQYEGVKDIVSLIRDIDMPYLILLVITTGFSITTRIFGFFGIVCCLKNKEYWPYFIILTGCLFLFTAMYLYLGQSRFRVPLEPILMLFCILGYLKVTNGKS